MYYIIVFVIARRNDEAIHNHKLLDCFAMARNDKKKTNNYG